MIKGDSEGLVKHADQPIRAHLLWIEILQVVEGEHRLKAFPEGLKLPGHSFVQSPVDHQLQEAVTTQSNISLQGNITADIV